MLAFWQCLTQDKALLGWSFLLWFSLGIGLLTKGPVVLVLCGLPCGLWALTQRKLLVAFRNTYFLPGIILICAIAAPWYYISEQRTPGFLEYFLVGEHFYRFIEPGWEGDLYGSAKDRPIGMIWLFLLLGSMPWGLIVVYELVFRRAALVKKATEEVKPWLLYLASWILMPTLFFTFAGNIIPTYVIPMLPAGAIFLVTVTTIKPKNVQKLGSGFAVVFLVLVVVSYKFYFEDHKYNQKPVLEEYKRLSQIDPGPLHYTGAETFSVVFYGEGKVSFGRDTWRYYNNPKTHYMGVRDMWVKSIEPVISARCSKQMQQGDISFWYCPALNNDN
jgi:4-amino-4-deoxy-L-arabinose transferase-like glycosyltransferase